MELVQPAIEDQALVTKAALNAAAELGINNRQLAAMLGVSASKLDRARGERTSFSAKDYELALLLIRIYRALYAILGGNQAQMQHWLVTPNSHLQEQAPLAQMQRLEGIVLVMRYLDAMRGRL